MNKNVNEKIIFFSGAVKERLRGSIREIILFGSRARGDAHEGSDYDFAVIVAERNKHTVEMIREIEVEFINRFDELSSSLIYSEKEWQRRKTLPIGINIEREGIRL